MIATIKPRDIVGKTRRRLAVELIVELEGIDKKIKAINNQRRELIAARGVHPDGTHRHRPFGSRPAPG